MKQIIYIFRIKIKNETPFKLFLPKTTITKLINTELKIKENLALLRKILLMI